MARVTFQVLEGLERGRIYSDLETPISIGREDDNLVRLNDERISRFHAKIQDDGDHIILTDLDSTNGTRVNGHPVQLHVLGIGDQLSIGRCLLLYGSKEQITAQAKELYPDGQDPSDAENHTLASLPDITEESSFSDDPDLSFEERLAELEGLNEELFPYGPPELPHQLTPLQRAQLSDLVAFVHDQLRVVIEDGEADTDGESPGVMQVDWVSWQKLLNVEMELATYLRRISDPEK
jgi:hypothetical protein